MARSYAKLLVSVWADTSDFRHLSASAQRLYFLLLSHPTMTACGQLPLQPRRWARLAPDTTAESIERDLTELSIDRKVLVDDDTEEVLVRTFIQHDGGYRTPNIAKAIKASIDRIESHRLRVAASDVLRRALHEASRPPDPPHPADSEEKPQVTSLDETLSESLDETHPSRDGLYTCNHNLKPEAFDPVLKQQHNPKSVEAQRIAAAAIDLLVEHKLATEQPRSVNGYRHTMPATLAAEWGERIGEHQRHHPDASAADIARAVLGLTTLDLRRISA